ncbi:MAG: phosphoglucosamine mutase [Clostridiales Family XIII bacterium]|jgi:phosphoglucosamine mutase|nr:phosphoglucosamine mutase [Clostridiales Family XIII bacterium]
MAKLFGTDGIRGIAGSELSEKLALKIGQSLIKVLKERKIKRPLVLIGRDSRLSGDMLENALAAGILSSGGDVYILGIIPTPAVAFLTKYYNADAGVVISASHNSYEFNGIKIFSKDGFKLSDEEEDEIENLILSNEFDNSEISFDKIGIKKNISEDAKKKYKKFLISSGKELKRKKNSLKILLDTANGAASYMAEDVFKELGFTVECINARPNGLNINDKAGSTHPEILSEKILKEKFDIGFAFDGDTDRLIAVDENGRIIDGDQMLYIFSKMLKAKRKLKNNTVVATIMSNIGLKLALKRENINLELTSVGDRYVLENMLKHDFILGGEQSGHLIFLDKNTTGDGMYAAIKILDAMLYFNKKLSELSNGIKIYPQVLINAKVLNKKKKLFEKDEEVLGEIEKIKDRLKGTSKIVIRQPQSKNKDSVKLNLEVETYRVVIRPSGTEPLIRVMIEGEEEEIIRKEARKLAKLIERKYGK